jgi:curved DNA-binding protein
MIFSSPGSRQKPQTQGYSEGDSDYERLANHEGHLSMERRRSQAKETRKIASRVDECESKPILMTSSHIAQRIQRSMAKDYYETLSVARDAEQSDIKRAFRKLAAKYHPDKNQGDTAAEDRFKEANEAYAVLSDPDQRRRYDTMGSAFHSQYDQDEILRNFDFGNVFSDMGLKGFQFNFGGGSAGPQAGFGPGGGYGFNAPPPRGKDTEQILEISFYESIKGGKRTVQFRLPDGSIDSVDVRIPAGISTQKKLRLRGRGLAAAPDGPRGDLYLRIAVAGHPTIRRKGIHLEVDAFVHLSLLLMGGEISVQGLENESTVRVPALTPPGTKLRLKGQGAPKMDQSGEHGNLYIVLKVELPDTLTEAQKEAVEALKQSGL